MRLCGFLCRSIECRACCAFSVLYGLAIESVAQGAGRYGNLGRNVFHGPGTFNTDFRIQKATHLTERTSLIIRGEAFNFFNHTQFYNPNSAIDSPTFGQVTLAHDPRLVQLSMQFTF
jgi:hypothetical protein